MKVRGLVGAGWRSYFIHSFFHPSPQGSINILILSLPFFFSLSSLGSEQRLVFGADGDFSGRRRGRKDHLHDGGLPEAARPVQGEGGGRKCARQGAAVRANFGKLRRKMG